MRKKLTDTISVAELKQMYESGMSYRDIAASLDVSYNTIHNYLKGEVTPRSKGGHYARRIPNPERASRPKSMDDLAAQNAANACIVVQERIIRLAGTVGEYTVNTARNSALCSIGGGRDRTEIRFYSRPDRRIESAAA